MTFPILVAAPVFISITIDRKLSCCGVCKFAARGKPLIFLRICRISWAYFATPISLKWRPSFLKSVLDRSWVSMCQFFRCLTCWTIKSFTSSILLLNAGLSCRGGILDIITILSLLLRDTLSMICRNSSLHCTRGWESMLFVPAASTVTSLDGICLIWAFICRAVLRDTHTQKHHSLCHARDAPLHGQ